MQPQTQRNAVETAQHAGIPPGTALCVCGQPLPETPNAKRRFKCATCGSQFNASAMKKRRDPRQLAKEAADRQYESSLTAEQKAERATKAGEAALKAAWIELLIDLTIVGLAVTRLTSAVTNEKFSNAKRLTPEGFVNKPLERAKKIKKIGWAIYIVEIIALAIIYYAL